MAKIIWSYIAYEDYKSITEFIAIDSEHYASLMAKKIWLEINRIEQNPKVARMVPEAGYLEEIREFILGKYRIIFKLKAKKHTTENI